jgi:GT2 family glycosyltransferase
MRDHFVSIIIKAFNEEKNIIRCLESAFLALEGLTGEVILADSASTDKTVELAKKYPIKIISLENPRERCCGIGPQLGYQVSKGEFVYILDADMRLEKNFLKVGLKLLEKDSRLAGVAGEIVEENVENYIFKQRKKIINNLPIGRMEHLQMGGLYRRSAIDDVGYFSNRNLNSFEELELGLRLVEAGWRLERIPGVAVHHYGYVLSSFSSLRKRIKSGYYRGYGQIFRIYFDKKQIFRLTKMFLHIYTIILLWMLSLFTTGMGFMNPLFFVMTILLYVSLFLFLALKKRNIFEGFFCFVQWNIQGYFFLLGFLQTMVSPKKPISYNLIK